MDGEARQYSVLIYPRPEEGDAPGAAVHMEISGDYEEFCENIKEWKERLCSQPVYPRGDSRELCECRISDGLGEDLVVSCDERTILITLLDYCADPGIAVRKLCCPGAVYTDITAVTALDMVTDDDEGSFYTMRPLQCFAKRDGRDVTVYFFGPFTGADGGYYYVLSNGIVEADGKRQYAGVFSYNVEWENSWINEAGVDESESYNYDVQLHTFLDTDGDHVTFSLLSGGRLYQKISRTKDAVIFYDTPDSYDLLACGFEQNESRRDVVFQNINGEYRYTAENRDSGKNRYTGVVYIPPELPDPHSLTTESAHDLCTAYIRALGSAFSGAKTYEANGYVFRHIDGTKDQYFLKTETFDLTAQWIPPRILKNSISGYPGGYGSFEASARIDVLEAVFYEGETRIAFLPRGYSAPGIRASVRGQNKTFTGDLNSLRERSSFPGEELPETMRLDPDFEDFLKNGTLWQSIRRAVINFGVNRLFLDPARLNEISREEMKERLYGEDMVADQGVIALATEMKNEFNRNGKIPNVALMGEAGTGKTELAKKLGKCVFDREVQEVAPPDLKGAYEGWTKYEVLSKLLEAAENNAILFVDEAYELMSDGFGREAVSLLLPLMTGRTKVDASTGDSGGSRRTLSVDFETGAVNGGARYIKPGVPPIWIAGYEDEIRLMLNQNKGLYRRLKRIPLTPPTKDQLYDKLCRELEHQRDNVAFKKYDILKKQFQTQKAMLTRFFMWGAQPQNSPYFANYAGVESFLGRCMDGIDFDCTEGNGITGQIEAIMTSIKRDVKRQLDTVRRRGGNIYAAGTADSDRIQMITDIDTRFDDLEGCENQTGYMQSIIDMLAERVRYDRYHITVPKGALLMGPPGVGKTFIARAMAGELQARFEADAETANKRVGFMSLSAPEITTKPVSFIASIFDRAEEYDVCVIFIDEVDAIARNRFQNENYSHFIELIRQMDGIEQRTNVFILAATNAYEFLDPAFTRSGRIDKKLFFTLPDQKARRALAERYILRRCGALAQFGSGPDEKGEQILSAAELRGVKKLAEETARITAGRAPGDIENIINTAFIMYDQEAMSPDRKPLKGKEPRFGNNVELGFLYRNIYEAVERFTVGDPHPADRDSGASTGSNDGGRFAVSVHEVGHALVEILYGREPFEKITSLPRGDALGYVRPSQRILLTKRDFEIRIRAAMGGRIAEEIVYGRDNISTGASSDMANATYWARAMVEQLGFTEKFGFMTLKRDTAQHLGVSAYSCSDAFREQSDQAVNELLKQLYQETRGLLAGRKELIETLAAEVVKRETMTGVEFIRFYRKVLAKKSGDPVRPDK